MRHDWTVMATRLAGALAALLALAAANPAAASTITAPRQTDFSFVTDYTSHALANEYLFRNGVPRIAHVAKFTDGKYYAYGLFSYPAHPAQQRMAVSDDLLSFKPLPLALKGSWGTRNFWPPKMLEAHGRYYMFYQAWRGPADGEPSGRIGVAIADSPTGPFTCIGRPLFDNGWHVIDPYPFADDDGRAYVLFSRDGSRNIVNGVHESHLYGIELDKTLTGVVGEPVLLAKPEQPWERKKTSPTLFYWNEAPVLLKLKGTYYLMYSALCFNGREYALGYATASSALGPYTKSPANPLLTGKPLWRDGVFFQAGHHQVVPSPDDSELWVVYQFTNPYYADKTSPAAKALIRGNRAIDKLVIRRDGTLAVNGPNIAWQPKPSGATGARNVALAARVTASSTAPGFAAAAINDEEIGFEERFAKNDWGSNGEQAGAWVRLSWDQPRELIAALVYKSADPKRRVLEGAIALDDGPATPVRLPDFPGAAGMLFFAEGTKAASLTFMVTRTSDTATVAGLSEITALGKP